MDNHKKIPTPTWPKIGQEVTDSHDYGIGTVVEVENRDGKDVALVDWGLNLEWIATHLLHSVA